MCIKSIQNTVLNDFGEGISKVFAALKIYLFQINYSKY